MSKIIKEYISIIDSIKCEIKRTNIRIVNNVNSEMIKLYFKMGKMISENYKYENRLIEDLSYELRQEFPSGNGFSVRNLKYMKKFYNEYKDDILVQQLVAQIP